MEVIAVAEEVRGRVSAKRFFGVYKGGSFFSIFPKFFTPLLTNSKNGGITIFAIGSEELSRRMEKRASF